MKALHKILLSSVVHLACLAQSTAGEFMHNEDKAAQPHRIAIIGGGVGGAAAAYFLHELSGGVALVDVYESGRVGGRLASVEVAGRRYEAGGSIIHPANQYMTAFVEELGLSHKEECEGSTGLFDGDEFVFRDSPWRAVTAARLLWRYGWDAFTLEKITADMLDNFNKIYKLQASGQAYKSVRALLSAMDPSFPGLTAQAAQQQLRQRGLGTRIVDEFVRAITLCNYLQMPQDLHAFVGMVAVAGAGADLWSVRGGNAQVAEQLLSKSRAALLHRHVTQVTAVEQPGGGTSFTVSSVEVSGGEAALHSEGSRMHYRPPAPLDSGGGDNYSEDNLRTQDYDAVIIATPLTMDKTDIRLVNLTNTHSFPGSFERCVATFVHGKLRDKTFRFPKPDYVDNIFVVTGDLFYGCVARQSDLEGEECSVNPRPHVFKIFSREILTDNQIKEMFSEVISTEVVDWRAYPHYEHKQQVDRQFELQPGLYHLNAIEWAASAMEMSAIAAKNVALLTLKHVTGDQQAGNTVTQKGEL